MPKATRTTDRRRTGRAKRVTGVVGEEANLQDQRKVGAYAPKAPTAKSEFSAGVSVGRTIGSGAGIGSSKNRAAPAVKKLGEK
ncbi:hypothetical protein [Streptomyces malaysiensis]|uniref:hypothetical protein n=1 Tax=Streptomyces malaysiensis TaxID=92644 RepID=UPI00142EBBA8|nr:hypothetical protein [Streptomyces malaysiensis]